MRTTLRHAALAAVASLTATIAVTIPALTSSPAAAATAWRSGIYGGGPAGAAAFGAWRTRAADIVEDFAPGDSWKNFSTLNGWSSKWTGTPWTSRFEATIPLTVGSTPMSDVTAGKHDVDYRAAASKLVSMGMGGAVIRLGHEFNGAWYTWSAARNGGSAYIAAYRHVHDVMASVGGARFTWEWNFSEGLGFDVTSAYPGDAYVDYVGIDLYDQLYGTKMDPAARWNKKLTEKYGLTWTADFADAHHKSIGFPEWGLDSAVDGKGGGGGDDPYFIQALHDWMSAHRVDHDVYFNRNPSDGTHFIGPDTSSMRSLFPNAAAMYRQTFGRGAAPVPAPTTPAPAPTSPAPAPTTPAPAPTTPTPTPTKTTPSPVPPTAGLPAVVFSRYAGRGGSKLLSRATVSGKVYVSVNAARASGVAFYLDDPGMARPAYSIDTKGPYDLAGTLSNGYARLYWTTKLRNGNHTLTIRVSFADGTSVTETVSFQVRN